MCHAARAVSQGPEPTEPESAATGRIGEPLKIRLASRTLGAVVATATDRARLRHRSGVHPPEVESRHHTQSRRARDQARYGRPVPWYERTSRGVVEVEEGCEGGAGRPGWNRGRGHPVPETGPGASATPAEPGVAAAAPRIVGGW